MLSGKRKIMNTGMMKKVLIPNTVKILSTQNTKSTKNTKNTQNYYSAYLNNKQNIYSFLNEESAKSCAMFLAEFKSMYNDWPIITEDNDLKNIKIPHGRNKNKYDILADEIVISDELIENMQSYSIFNNIGLLGITYFDYTFKKGKIDMHILPAIYPQGHDKDSLKNAVYDQMANYYLAHNDKK
jgi:hypothetical protein